MNQIISITTTEGKKTVNARELHEFLEVKTRFNDWITNRIKSYGFVSEQDYTVLTENLVNGGKAINYHITLDMAKELSMVERNEKGQQARRYFIECERKLQEAKPALPGSYIEALEALLSKEREKLQLESQVAQLLPDAEFARALQDADNLLTASQVAKPLGISAQALNQFLINNEILRATDKLPAYRIQDRVNDLFKIVVTTFETSGGQRKSREYVKWTEAGRRFIHLEYSRKNILKLGA